MRRPLLAAVAAALLVVGCAEAELDGDDTSGAPDTGVDTAPRDTASDTGSSDGEAVDTRDEPLDTAVDTGRSVEDADGQGESGPCGGRCAAGEVCADAGCVDPCAQEGAACGTVDFGGRTVDCGSCGDEEYCSSDHACRDICADSGAECGNLFWGGKSVDCGSCSGACFHNRCVSSGYRSIDGGHRHSCATDGAGGLYCWGADLSGQLGNGSDGASSTPVPLPTSGTALEVRSLRFHSCARFGSGSVSCWGSNNDGQIGDGSTDTVIERPTSVAQIGSAVDVAAGNLHSCAVLQGGEIRCWGAQAFGRLGNGKNSTASRRTPVAVQNISDAVQVVAGGSHSCALLADGSVQCWGNGSDGQLGNGLFSGSSTPVDVEGLEGVVDLGAGADHTCAVTQDGDVRCWGYGADLQLGNGATSNEPVPVDVQQLDDAVAVVAGKSHTCARDAAGEVFCWGSNVEKNSGGDIVAGGQLGDGSYSDSGTPVAVSSPGGGGRLQDVVAIGAGRQHTCGVTDAGDAYCWGTNDDGQLGDGTKTRSNQPVSVQ